jgi:antitoxin MazE
MSTVIKTKIVRIGNSQGIRIPKMFLEQSHLKDEVELELLDNQIVIRSTSIPRHNWDIAFREMAKHGDDKLLDQDLVSTRWDENEWQW